MPDRSRSAPKLSIAIYGFVLLGALLAAAGSLTFVESRLAQYRQDVLARALNTRAGVVELDIERTLHADWRNLRRVSEKMAADDPAEMRLELDALVYNNDRISWAGVATADGTVRDASGGLLEGQDVSRRTWFRRGLIGDFAGDVHEAVLLAQLLPAEDGGPRRFLDLSTPVRNKNGEITGVLGMHIDFPWFARHLAEMANAAEIGVIIVDREGRVVMGSDPSLEGAPDTPSVRAAVAGAGRTGLETWPDGKAYLTTVMPRMGYRDLPSFGWSMVARIDDNALASAQTHGLVALAVFLSGFGVLLALLTYVFVQYFVRPFARLSDSAARVLTGSDEYPFEAASTAEVATLSAAVGRLQFLQQGHQGRGGHTDGTPST